ncbi:MAG: helix-turn-helix transcriptional regulator [Anaerolineales bacterium]|jgi:hypothetical protein
MTIKDKLSQLTERQREVLRMVCGGYNYKAIGETLYIAESTVKAHMGNIYQKLELDLLPPAQRTKTLFEEYCPALQEIPPEMVELVEEPEPVPEDIEKMVEEDEKALVLWQPKSVVEIEPKEVEPVSRPRRFRWVLVGMILGAMIVGIPFIALRDLIFPGEASIEAIVKYVDVTVEVPVEVTSVVTATSEPNLPTQTPVVQEKVVVVTATPEPTLTSPPGPTEPVNTPQDAVLEVGEWWKHEGVWLRVSHVEFDSDGIVDIELEMWNKTGNTLIFEWVPYGNFSLADNTGHMYTNSSAFGRGDNSEVVETDDLVEITHDNYGSAASYFDSYFFKVSVTEMAFTIIDFSRVPFAQWHFTVPK